MAVTVLPVDEFNVKLGVHVYPAAPLALRAVLPNGQIVGLLADAATTTVLETVIVTVLLPAHDPLAPSTVYVVVIVGVEITVPLVLVFKNKLGVHV